MASTSVASRSFPTLRLLAAPFRWFFRSRRRVLMSAAVLVAMIAALPVWWATQLMGLPDVGDPFDMREFRSFTIPDDRNAYVVYRQAVNRIRPIEEALAPSGVRVLSVLPMVSSMLETQAPGGPKGANIELLAPWSKADPRVRRWAEENGEALALYRRGADRPDAFNPDRADSGDRRTQKEWTVFRSLHFLALLEASRLEERGDMAGAWGWYRTALRASYHYGLRGDRSQRLYADFWRNDILARATAWAADPRTTRAMVRQALDEVIACGVLAPSDAYTIKAEYPELLRILDSSRSPGRELMLIRFYTLFGDRIHPLDPEQIYAILDGWRSWRREPERSRRVVRLAVANWLAFHERPPGRRPAPDPDVPGPLRFYAFGPESPAAARALSPVDLGLWLSTTIDATPLLREWSPAAIRAREARGFRALVVLLATELYRRDHGSVPLEDEALVGPYLKALPADGLEDGDAPAGTVAPATKGPTDSTGREKSG
jgi:hypothetical protein